MTGKVSDGPPQDLTNWLLGAIASLAGFIAALWKRNESKNSQDITKLEQRIKDRDALIDEFKTHASECDQKLKKLEIEMAKMQGQISRNKTDADNRK